MITLKSLSPQFTLNSDSHQTILSRFKVTIERSDIGFFRFIEKSQHTDHAQKVAEKFKSKKLLVHVGIGGSSLGPEMLLSALGISKGKQVQFVNNIDSDMLTRQMQAWSPNDTFFYIVSKSGGTPETLAALAIISRWLESHKISQAQWNQFIVICTDPEKGDLRTFAKRHSLDCLEVPPSIGGRFSVLTDVGALTAYWAGINVDELRNGAREMCQELLAADPHKNILTSLTQFIVEQNKNGRSQTVLMPYSSLLKDFTAWWVQLWGESLGKKSLGLTPIMAYGATDQHSQMQLFMQGPQDKVILMLECETAYSTLSMSSDLNLPGTEILQGFSLHQLMKAEFEGTLLALQAEGRPYSHLSLQALNAHSLGKLILLFQSLTVSVGLSLGVDPFDQPGVEAGKNFARDWLIKHKK